MINITEVYHKFDIRNIFNHSASVHRNLKAQSSYGYFQFGPRVIV